MYCRYLDSVTNKDSTLPPIPHLHSLLTDNGEPHPEVDIFKLVRSSYEVFNLGDDKGLLLCMVLYWFERHRGKSTNSLSSSLMLFAFVNCRLTTVRVWVVQILPFEFNLTLNVFRWDAWLCQCLTIIQFSPAVFIVSTVLTVYRLTYISLFLLLVWYQKFGSIRADVIEQMRFKQRLRVIQTIEDTTKRNVVRTYKYCI